MGLLDDPGGWLFGEESKQGAIDRRVNREPRGEKWWQQWDAIYGPDGSIDPQVLLPQLLNIINAQGQAAGEWLNGGSQRPVSVSIAGGPSVKAYPKGPIRNAQAAMQLGDYYARNYGGLLSPWMTGGQTLEHGRMGSAYNQRGGAGVAGAVLGAFGGRMLDGAAKGLGEKLFGDGTSSSVTPSAGTGSGGGGGAGTLAGGGASAAGAKSLGSSAPAASSSAWSGFGSPATVAGGTAAGTATAATALPSGAGAYMGGMYSGMTAAESAALAAEAAQMAGVGTTAGTTATTAGTAGTAGMSGMAGMGGILWPAAIMAAMGIASQYLAKATDSSHTPQTAKESIDMALNYLALAKEAERVHGKGGIGPGGEIDPTLDNRQMIKKIAPRASLQYQGYDLDTLRKKLEGYGYDDPFGENTPASPISLAGLDTRDAGIFTG